MRSTPSAALVALLGAFAIVAQPAALDAATVVLGASRDNTLYEDGSGALSNGAGDGLFSGLTPFNGVRRALIAFEVAGSIPSGSTIQSATLELNASRTVDPPPTVGFSLHRVLSSWGEASSVAPGEGGGGASSTPGDATWLHGFFPGTFWTTPGGDFAAVASTTTFVSVLGPVQWSSAAMATDVQGWLNDPTSNHGWILLSPELAARTAYRFDSREHTTPANRPTLTVEFEPSSIVVPALSPLGLAVLATLFAVAGLALRRRRTA